MWFRSLLLTSIILPIRFVVALLPPVDDPNALKKYNINYVTPQFWDENIANNKSLLDNGSILEVGNDMKCLVSNVTKLSTLEKLRSDQNKYETTLISTLNQGVNIINKALDGHCVGFRNGFWTYQFCPKKEFSQFHEGNTDSSMIYVLGKPKKNLLKRDFTLLYNDFGYYVNEVVGSGDICDLTGTPRLIEIEYVCGSAVGPATIQWVRETATCQYEAQISVPELCGLELLSLTEDKSSGTAITCIHPSSEETAKHNLADLVTYFDPIFLGQSIYLLAPNGKNHEKKANLMYTEQLNDPSIWDSPTEVLYKAFTIAFSRVITLGLLHFPDGSKLENGDTFSWIAEIVDITGKPLSKIKVSTKHDGSMELLIYKDLPLLDVGNFEYYSKEKKLKSTLSPNDGKYLLDMKDFYGEIPLELNDAQGSLQELLGQMEGFKLAIVNPETGQHREVDSSFLYEELNDGEILAMIPEVDTHPEGDIAKSVEDNKHLADQNNVDISIEQTDAVNDELHSEENPKNNVDLSNEDVAQDNEQPTYDSANDTNLAKESQSEGSVSNEPGSYTDTNMENPNIQEENSTEESKTGDGTTAIEEIDDEPTTSIIEVKDSENGDPAAFEIAEETNQEDTTERQGNMGDNKHSEEIQTSSEIETPKNDEEVDREIVHNGKDAQNSDENFIPKENHQEFGNDEDIQNLQAPQNLAEVGTEEQDFDNQQDENIPEAHSEADEQQPETLNDYMVEETISPDPIVEDHKDLETQEGKESSNLSIQNTNYDDEERLQANEMTEEQQTGSTEQKEEKNEAKTLQDIPRGEGKQAAHHLEGIVESSSNFEKRDTDEIEVEEGNEATQISHDEL
ncbi:Yos9p NDAI_0A05510 [Naumovozyma dairenensis CBS 421]|uniref:Endoplasmic reticulum lectin n=1 Tax=Naumovozyma dairenensis (strain ATCC 10597 / BCRC 20456 / CBS 421 / NBRC 0211 / NRRL Y-12639) TaxID=1071378 RepID=G0W4G8_NAUDC|nr:hypothetical protein NDAI_0A05510 [Naumovozyma dairenensis CBS 421]CCD22706.1 hypothetical protein NDAI_0A05510 [Naumovozyma dairenensis CBS 421]